MIVSVIFLLLLSANGQKSGQGYYSRNGPSNWLLDKNSMTRKISQARIIQPPQDAAVLEGEDALFFCGVEGSPEPIVNFLLDGQSGKLSGETGKVILLDGGGGSLLRLFKVSTKQNGIKVECFASNHVGNDKASAHLKVYKYSDHVPIGFPKFVRPPQTHSVDVGKRIQLQCEAEGAPDLKFVWLKNGVPIRSNQQGSQALGYRGRYTYDGSYSGSNIVQQPLEFENVNPSDDANYECLVSNKFGSILSSKVHLAVKDTFYPPTIIEQQDKVEVRQGKGANLTCTSTGNPKPQVRWLTDQEKPLTEAVDWKAILFLTDVTEPRDYICVANNSLGRVQHLVRVEIIEVPRAPADLQVVERGPTFAILRWFPGRTDDTQPDPTRPVPVPITSYTLIVTDLDDDNGRQAMKRKITGISPRKIEVDGYVHQKVPDLKPDHRYTAEVYALGAPFGISDASNQISFKTLELPPSGSPLSIRATATSSESISISWKPPIESNGKIIGYKVYYSTHLRNKLEQWQMIQTNKPHAVLQGLSSMATYYLKVSAFNSAGDGPLSDAFPIIVNPGVPPQPVNFRGVSPSPTSIQLIWSPPELPHGMNILEYQLQCRPASEIAATTLPQTPLAISIPAKHTAWTIKSLQSDTLYQVVLTARNQHGLGVPAKLEIRTLSNLATYAIDYDDQSHGVFEISNYPCLDDPGICFSVPSPPQDLTLNNFQKETAVTGGFPMDYIVLKLQWKPPAETYGELKGYQVSFRLVGPPELLTSSKSDGGDSGKMGEAESTPTLAVRRNVTGTSYTSTQIDNIQFGRIYQFEVAAYNNIDIGVPAHLNITTPENVPGSFPLHLRVKGLSTNSVEVSWSPPPKESRNGIIIGYQVHYYMFSSPQNTANYQNTTQPFLRIDGLQERTVYAFRVRAFTSSGPGPWSALSTIQITAEVPDPPTHIKAERINQRQIKVTWNLPRRSTYRINNDYHQRPIPVTGFRIHYAAHDTTVDPSSERMLEVGAVTMATVDDVSPNESYIIKIQSRGTDKRFGSWSDPVIVSASRYGFDQRGEAYQLSRVADLRCFGIKSADMTNPMNSSLKITWLPPSDRRLIKEYEIQISGVKSFINELNEPVRLTLGPRKLTVSPTKQPTFGSPSSIRNDFLAGDQDQLLVHTVDKLEPNAVFDVKVRPIYETVAGRQIMDTEALWEQTSCRTRMHPPVNITAPVPVAFKADTNEVIVRLLRVSENLGPIRKYYLIVSNHDRAGVLSTADHVNWHTELLRISPKGNEAETRVAAEFTQLAFESTQLEIQVGGQKQLARFRRSLPRKQLSKILQGPSNILNDEPHRQSYSEILLYDCDLRRGKWYKAILLACIYPDIQYSIPLNKRPINSYYNGNQMSNKPLDQTDKDGDYDDSINPNYCSSSRWSVTFTPEENLIVNDADGSADELGGVGASASVNGVTSRAGPSFFTIILVTVIIGIALVALICIAVQCFFRRRPKQQRNSIGAKLPKTDTSLKIPLMPPTHHKNLVAGIDTSDMHPSVEISTKNDYLAESTPPATSNMRTSPTPRLSKVLENGTSNAALPPSGTPLRQTPQSVLGQTLPGQSPISLNHLAVHVGNLKSFDNNGLYKEYEAIEQGSGFTWHHANMELNKPKNRYANVIAYDHSRVILNQLPGVPCSDYINANYLDGYRLPNAYIATQGPLPETFGDFWRMIWEQNSQVIVMMTKLEERSRIKCDQYWPSRGTEIYQIYPENEPRNPPAEYISFAVTLLESTDYAYYTIRTFNLQKMTPAPNANETNSQSFNGGYNNEIENLQPVQEPRQIKQFQFTAWPDCGAPEQPQPLLLFIRQVCQARQALRAKQSQRGGQENGISEGFSQNTLSNRLGPTVVHCSAGVGRTGAFIVIDSQLDRIRAENTVDIFGAVSRMRSQRNFMVQTEQQYAFLYEVMVEAVQLTGSEVSAHSLYNYVMKLRQTAPTSMLSMYLGDHVPRGGAKPNFPQNITALELEFQRVSINLQISSQCTSALLPENRNKNRLDSVLPYESNRVVLSAIRGFEGTDYINASFVDGYWHERAYIATQAPLASTTKDFWRMIWQHNSPIIVMLSQVVENCREQCFQYWPSERSQRYEQFLVEPMVEYNMPSFVLREFRITDTQDGQSRTLRQFQFSDWPDNGVPISRAAETLIDLISQVHKTQAQFGQDGPITVHCSAGAGRTGIFIALSILLERMRCEGMVDLLLTTRLLRSQRSNMIEDESQYAFCYTALLEFLASF